MMDKWPGLQRNLLVHRWKRTTSFDAGPRDEEGVETGYKGKGQKRIHTCVKFTDILSAGLLGRV